MSDIEQLPNLESLDGKPKEEVQEDGGVITAPSLPEGITHWYDNPEYNDGIHYTTQKALSHKFEYALINGGRSNGKTTGWQLEMIDDFFNYGYVYGKVVRKFDFDVRRAIKWFGNVAVKYLKEVYHHELVVDRCNYYVVPDETQPDRYLPKEQGKRKAELNRKLLCEVFNLNLEVDNKSHDYSYIKTLIFEEYTLINQYDYLMNEVEHFQSLISTINRERDDLRVVFIGNTISKHNPYFEWLGVNVNDLRLKSGDSKMLQCKSYDNGARIYVEFVPTVYGDVIKCPRILKVGNNEVATTGDWVISEYVVDTDFDNFINGLNKHFNVAFRLNNKLYYHLTCVYKDKRFNIVTNRLTKIKTYNNIYDMNCSAIERIQKGSLNKGELISMLTETTQLYETLFSDDEIEYAFNKLFKRR